MNHFITAKKETPLREIDLPPVKFGYPPLGELGMAREVVRAFFDGDSRTWGRGYDLNSAIGDCLRTAGVELPDRFRSQTNWEIGSAVRKGLIAGVSSQGLKSD